MGFLNRMFGKRADDPRLPLHGTKPSRRESSATTILGGHETLEVVGESFHQDELWGVVEGWRSTRVRHAIRAVLVPEPTNPYDPNAVQVLIDGRLVGHLSRDDASVYLPGLLTLGARHGGRIGLDGQVVGGGPRPGGVGMLGVFLDHDPADFGLRAREAAHIGELRTGLSQAVATDMGDDSYDLSWYEKLSGAQLAGDIPKLRGMLLTEDEPIDRHFMMCELEQCLYKSRDSFSSALDEFDAVCREHDAEMPEIRAALYKKFSCVPIIPMYRQAAIRCQKSRDWNGVRAWAERGLSIYGSEAARPEAVEDLQKRLAHAIAKASEPPGSRSARPEARRSGAVTQAPSRDPVVETLVCAECSSRFDRVRTRGRKPSRCPACRGAEPDAALGAHATEHPAPPPPA